MARLRRRWLVLSAFGALALAITTGRLWAAPPGMPGPFSFFTGGNAVSAWTREEAHTGSFSVKLATKVATGGAWAGVWVDGVSGTTLSDITALSFWVKGYTGAGSPRFSIVLADGVVLWPSALWCGSPSPAINWYKVDVVGGTCTIYDSAGHAHDGWASVLDAHGNVTIQSLFLIQDEGPAVSYVDDITVGINGTEVSFGEPGDNGLPRRGP